MEWVTATAPEAALVTRLEARLVLAASRHLGWIALQTMIRNEPGLRIVGEVTAGESAIGLSERLQPDAVLMDAYSEKYSVVAAAREFRERLPRIKLLVFANQPNQCLERALAELGAEGFILWDDLTPAALHYALGATLTAGLCVGSRKAVEELVARPHHTPSPAVGELLVASRERDVLNLLAEGFVTREIAERTGLGARTVERTVCRLKDRLRVTALHELRRKARELGYGT